MNIGFFIGSLSGKGGIERVTVAIANELVRKGYFVYIVSLWDGLNSTFSLDQKINVYQLFEKRVVFKYHFLKVVFKLRKFIKQNRIDILIDADTILSVYSVPALVGTKAKHIAWEHFNFNVNYDLYIRKLARKLIVKYCDSVVTLTETDKNLWLAHTRVKTKIVSIENPSPFETISNAQRDWSSKKVLAIGRLTYQKGFDILLDIWHRFKQNSLADGWKLCIVGGGEEKDTLLQKISDLAIQDTVETIPFQNDITQQYKSSDIYVLTSRFEGLVMTLIEAQSMGLPCIAFNCETGPKEIITDNESGFLVEPGNDEDFVQRMLTLSSDKNLREKMGLKAIENSKRFNIQMVSQKWQELFENISKQ